MANSIAEWLEENKDKFEVHNNASTPFINYYPKKKLYFRHRLVTEEGIFIKLRDEGKPIAYNADTGRKIQSSKPDKDFRWE